MSEQTLAAIGDAIRAHSVDEGEGHLPIDWVVSAALISPDGEHSIGGVNSRVNMPNYVTVGLLTEGLRLSTPDNN